MAWIALAGVIVFALLQMAVGDLNTPAAPRGIVSFELAGDVGAARAILASWGAAKQRAAAIGLVFDFGFLISYATLLWCLCQWAATVLQPRSPLAAQAGRLLAWGQIVAGVCDALENVSLLVELSGRVSPPWPQAARFFAVAKFVLVILAACYILVAIRCLPGSDEVLSIAGTIRFSIGVSLVAPLLLFVGQSQEALRVLGEDAQAERWKVAVFFAAALALALMSWYWARVLLYLFQPGMPAAQAGPGWAARNLPRLCAAVPLALFALALWVASRAMAPEDNPTGPATLRTPSFLDLRLMAGGMSLLAILVVVLLYLRRKLLLPRRPLGPRRVLAPRVRDLDRSTLTALVVTAAPGLLLFLLFVCLGTERSQWASNLGPIAILFIGLGLWIPMGSILVYLSERARVPFLTLLVIAAVAFSAFDLNDNHAVRHIRAQEAQPPPGVGDSFTRWLNQRKDLGEYVHERAPGSAYPVFLVAAEGGGLRAAYQSAHVLAVIQDADPAFAQHTFAISGVSGGSLGAAVFAGLASRYTSNTLQHTPPLPLPRRKGHTLNWVEVTDAVLRRDMLSPPLASLLLPDLAQRFLPWAIDRFDRGRALEGAFEKAWAEGTRGDGDAHGGDEFARPFYFLNQDFANRCVPALFLNTTRVETGDRMVISTLYPSDPGFSGLQSLAEIDPGMSLNLSAAVGLSARFPVITPSGFLPICEPIRQTRPVPTLAKYRYVDGGYFENSGITTLTEILTALRPDQSIPGRPRWYPILIRIGFSGQAERPTAPYPPVPGPCPTRPRRSDGFDEALTPLKTLYNTRDARGATADEHLKTQVRLLQEAGRRIERIEFDFRERQVPLALGWLLSNKARLDMRNQVGAPLRIVPGSSVNLAAAGNPGQFGLVLDGLARKLPMVPPVPAQRRGPLSP
jgi:hypothetical protein